MGRRTFSPGMLAAIAMAAAIAPRGTQYFGSVSPPEAPVEPPSLDREIAWAEEQLRNARTPGARRKAKRKLDALLALRPAESREEARSLMWRCPRCETFRGLEKRCPCGAAPPSEETP